MKKTNAALLKELATLQAAYDQLQIKFVQVSNQLTVAQEMSALQFDTMRHFEKLLSQKEGSLYA